MEVLAEDSSDQCMERNLVGEPWPAPLCRAQAAMLRGLQYKCISRYISPWYNSAAVLKCCQPQQLVVYK